MIFLTIERCVLGTQAWCKWETQANTARLAKYGTSDSTTVLAAQSFTHQSEPFPERLHHG
jgi:hypothetical protein